MPNNREFALIFWLSIFFIWVIFQKSARESIKNLCDAFFQKKIIIPIVFLLCYCMLSVELLFILKIWSLSQLTTTIFWFFSTALSVFFNIKKIEDEKFLKNFAIDQMKIFVFIEFLINFVVFDFWVELILMPIGTIISMMLVISKNKEEHKQVSYLLESILGIYGIFLLLHTVFLIITNGKNLDLLQFTKDFSIAPLLSLSLLPFIYLLGLYVAYENFFIRVMFSSFDVSTQSIIKKQTIIYLNLSLKQLKLWAKEFKLYEMNDLESTKIALNKFKQKYKLVSRRAQ